MAQDKFTAVWISHTSIGDFLRCPRAYYLKHIYKDPKTGHKIKLMGPALALGQSVHEVLESLSVIPKETRFSAPLMDKFDVSWKKVAGRQGGFLDESTEYAYKKRGQEMLRRVWNSPGPIAGLAVKIQKDLPYYWISEEDNIILCGKIDWLEYLPETDSVHIIDFKTGKNEEDGDSLQLPIYHLLVHNCQHRKVTKASYWYLEKNDFLTEKVLPNLEEAHQKVLDIGRQMKLARQIQRFKCPKDGCSTCGPLETVLEGKAELVGTDEFKYDVYILRSEEEEAKASILL
jgi:ATP-dependent helicase/DNAse subunit B